MGLTSFKRKKLDELWCHYCKRLIPPGEETVDHKVPVVRNGPNTDANLVWSCYICNILKSDMPYQEFVWRISISTPQLEELKTKALYKRVGSPEFALLQRRWVKFQNRIVHA